MSGPFRSNGTRVRNFIGEEATDLVCPQPNLNETVEVRRPSLPYLSLLGGGVLVSRLILARWAPIAARLDLPDDAPDGQCRYLEAAVKGVLLASACGLSQGIEEPYTSSKADLANRLARARTTASYLGRRPRRRRATPSALTGPAPLQSRAFPTSANNLRARARGSLARRLYGRLIRKAWQASGRRAGRSPARLVPLR